MHVRRVGVVCLAAGGRLGDPKANYELNELIVLTPQSAYPLSVLPPNLVDILFLDSPMPNCLL